MVNFSSRIGPVLAVAASVSTHTLAASDALAGGPTGMRSIPVQWQSSAPRGGSRSGWHLVRTPGPEKTGDIVSMMRTADLLNSDPDFAGMAIRCQEKAYPQIAFVLVTPFKPRSKAKVTVATGSAPVNFDGIVIGPGTMVGLPDEAAPLLRSWQTAKTLNVEIAGEDLTVKGTVPLTGLAEALTQLETSCPR